MKGVPEGPVCGGWAGGGPGCAPWGRSAAAGGKLAKRGARGKGAFGAGRVLAEARVGGLGEVVLACSRAGAVESCEGEGGGGPKAQRSG